MRRRIRGRTAIAADEAIAMAATPDRSGSTPEVTSDCGTTTGSNSEVILGDTEKAPGCLNTNESCGRFSW